MASSYERMLYVVLLVFGIWIVHKFVTFIHYWIT